jgi:citrate lyase beta subunit
MYVPGSDWAKLEKAAGLALDCACLDLEDGVAPERKEEARTNVVRALGELDFGDTERLVRINEAGSGPADADLDAILPARPDGIVLPKVSNPDQVRAVSQKIAVAEQAQNLPLDSIALLVQIESALGLVNLKEIAGADERLDALIFGAEDYAADLGARRSTEAMEVFTARSLVAAHAAAFGLAAIDMIWVDFKDEAGLERLAGQGADLGYSGIQIIHPDQIESAQRTFTPNEAEVAAAQRVVGAYEASLVEGRGAFALDGKMVDMPMVKAAQQVLARAGSLGDQ